MALPWLTVVDTLLDLTSLALSRKSRRGQADPEPSMLPGRALGHLETRLTGVVMAALKEAFDRDASRLELEREQAERERVRAERMLKLELLRQAADREIGRLRLLAGVAVGSWVGTLLLSTRLAGGPIGARAMLGVGWLLLLAAVSLSFAAQSRISVALGRVDDAASVPLRQDDLMAGTHGAMVSWLVVLGLGVIGLAVLIG
jgi:hypothetical protein